MTPTDKIELTNEINLLLLELHETAHELSSGYKKVNRGLMGRGIYDVKKVQRKLRVVSLKIAAEIYKQPHVVRKQITAMAERDEISEEIKALLALRK